MHLLLPLTKGHLSNVMWLQFLSKQGGLIREGLLYLFGQKMWS